MPSSGCRWQPSTTRCINSSAQVCCARSLSAGSARIPIPTSPTTTISSSRPRVAWWTSRAARSVSTVCRSPRSISRSPISTWSSDSCGNKMGSDPVFAAPLLDHLVLVGAPQLHLLDVAAKAADRHAAPFPVAADDAGEHPGFDLRDLSGSRAVVVAQHRHRLLTLSHLHLPGENDGGPAPAQHRAQDPAGGALCVAHLPPALELLDHLHRQARTSEDPCRRVLGAGALAQIDPVGFQADEAGN